MRASFGENFGMLVRRYREGKAWSLGHTALVALGDEAKKSRLSELENGKVKKPHAKTIFALAAALEIPNEEVERCRPSPDTELVRNVSATKTAFDDVQVELFEVRTEKNNFGRLVEVRREIETDEVTRFVKLEGRRSP